MSITVARWESTDSGQELAWVNVYNGPLQGYLEVKMRYTLVSGLIEIDSYQEALAQIGGFYPGWLVVRFLHEKRVDGQELADWPSPATYRQKSAQLVANLLAVLSAPESLETVPVVQFETAQSHHVDADDSGTEQIQHWSEDPRWEAPMQKYEQLVDRGHKTLTLDLVAINEVVYNGGGPAYRLLDGMVSVKTHEGMNGLRGAPRLLLATLADLAKRSR